MEKEKSVTSEQKNRETIGKLARDLKLSPPDKVNVTELGRKMLEEYTQNVFDCMDRGRKKIAGNFYLVVLTKKERLMNNVLRNYFFFRRSCPTPEYDQTVFLFGAKSENLEHLWTLPAKDVCIYLKNNAHFVEPSEWRLLEYVLKFSNGDLYKISKKLNKEKAGSNILDK